MTKDRRPLGRCSRRCDKGRRYKPNPGRSERWCDVGDCSGKFSASSPIDAINYPATDEAILSAECELLVKTEKFQIKVLQWLSALIQLTQEVNSDRVLYFGTRPRDLGYGAAVMVPSGAWPWGWRLCDGELLLYLAELRDLGRWISCILRRQADFKNEWMSTGLYLDDCTSIGWLWDWSASVRAACNVGEISGPSYSFVVLCGISRLSRKIFSHW